MGQLELELAQDELPCLLHLSDAEVHDALASVDWDLGDADTDEFTHGVHSYPAKFIPQLPARFISALSRPGELVVDPFSGGGTTGVEALRLGRPFVGLDANPVGALLGRVKTTPLAADDERCLADVTVALRRAWASDPLERKLAAVPDIPNIEKWYSPVIVDALAAIKAIVCAIERDAARDVAMAAFANAAARVSFQESETRYVSRPRPVDPDEPFRRFLSELTKMTAKVRALPPQPDTETRFLVGDARQRQNFPIANGEASLVVTSPPYPNAYDYHLYHRFRLLWLGEQPSDLRRVEIGSHLKHQTESDPAASYEADMTEVLTNLHQVLADGRHCVLVVGDGIYRGQQYETASRLAALARDIGWATLTPITRSLPATRRAVTSAGRRLRQEQILVLRKASSRRVVLVPPAYQRFPYECDLARREAEALSGGRMDSSSELVFDPDPAQSWKERLSNLAFWHGYRAEAEEVPTIQRLIEGLDGRRKQSTYATHGLHRYKGKFYPQLAKALLNLSDLPPSGALVLDPFGGSGTVMLEAALAGHDAVSIDCSPLAASVAHAKTDVLHVAPLELTRAQQRLSHDLAGVSTEHVDWSQFEPSTHEELTSWFAAPVLAKLAVLLGAVRNLKDDRLVAFYEALVSDLVREVSHQDPRDLRIRRRKEPLTDAPVFEAFNRRADAAVAKILRAHESLPDLQSRLGVARSVLGNSADAATLDVLDRPVDVVVSSPPYATALPYIDTDRLSLAAVYGYDKKRRAELEKRLIGSRETHGAQQRETEALIESTLDEQLPPSTVNFLRGLLAAVRDDETAGFRRRQLPTVLARYFLGIASVIDNLRLRVSSEAHLWFVLGDSRSTIGGQQRVVPTVAEFRAIAAHVGLEVIETIPITVTREDVVHARHAITENAIVHLRAAARASTPTRTVVQAQVDHLTA